MGLVGSQRWCPTCRMPNAPILREERCSTDAEGGGRLDAVAARVEGRVDDEIPLGCLQRCERVLAGGEEFNG
jgi:hypothetical protein